MNMKKWLGHKDRRRGQGHSKRRTDHRQQALGLEGLEGRRLLSTMIWSNRGNDGFETYDLLAPAVPGKLNSTVARELVDQAIIAWQQVIRNFNFQLNSGDPNQYFLEVRVDELTDGTSPALGRAAVTALDNIGKPREGRIRLDDDGGSRGWYFDTVLDAQGANFLFDHAEFNELKSRFAADRIGGPNDFYTTILHEVGHAVGITTDDDLPGLRINEFLEIDESSPQQLIFSGPTTTATFTNGHLATVHRNDLMNEGDGFGIPGNFTRRLLISDLDAHILADAYQYDITLPSHQSTTLDTFLINLNKVTRELVVNGDPEVTADQITINGPIVSVNEVTTNLLVLQPTSIRVGPVGLGTGSPDTSSNEHDTINLDVQFATSPLVRVDAGTGNDTINVGMTSRSIDVQILDIEGGAGSNVISIFDNLGVAGGYGFFSNNEGSFLLKSLPGDILPLAIIQYNRFEDLFLEGNNGGGTYSVFSDNNAKRMTLFGGSGPDTYHLSQGNLDTFDGTVNVIGGDGVDTLLVDDRANQADTSYVFSPGSLLAPLKLTRTVRAKSINVGIAGIESLDLLGGVGDDSLTFTGAPAEGAIHFDPGAGNDTLGGMATSNLFRITTKDAGTVSRREAADIITFTSTENLRGNAFDDTFRFANGTRVSGRVDGLGGSDTLDYSAYTTRVNIHMILGLATGIGSGGTFRIGTIENAIGGSTGDIFVGDGADNIFLGNGGDDAIDARDGNDIVVGGDGNDRIRDDALPSEGVTERNLLIGGQGADVITGNSFKEELVIGGSTVFDTDLTALRAILAEWKSAAPIETRVAHLRGTLLKFGVPNPTVFDDAIADIMTVGTGIDWFFASADDVTDRGSDDFLN